MLGGGGGGDILSGWRGTNPGSIHAPRTTNELSDEIIVGKVYDNRVVRRLLTYIRPYKKDAVLSLAAVLVAAVSVLFAGAASAQDLACPAGGRGGAGGDAGRSTGGNGGLAFTVGGLASSTGSALAPGGNGGSARGGAGGRGGTGVLPVCNQNTNGGGSGSAAAPRTAAAAPAAAAAPRYGTGGGSPAYGVGGGLARTGAHTSIELGLAGIAFVIGGALLFFGQPIRRLTKVRS